MSLIEAEIADGIGRLRLTRPKKRNALTNALVDEAVAAMERFRAAGVEVAVLEADPPVFCAGNDLDEAGSQPDRPAADRLLCELRDREIFWVAAVTGPALGAGVAVVAVCPVAVASNDAWFSLPEIHVGLFPSVIHAYIEPIVGVRRSLTMGLTSDMLCADEAATLGLVTEAVEPNAVTPRAIEWARRLMQTPLVTAAARQAWQTFFATPSFDMRADQLERILAAQGPLTRPAQAPAASEEQG